MFGFFRSHRNPVFFGGLSSSLNLPESLVLTAVPLEIPFGTLHARRVAPWILSDLRSCSEFPSLVAPRGCKEAYGMSISVEPAWVCMSLHTNVSNMGSRWFKMVQASWWWKRVLQYLPWHWLKRQEQSAFFPGPHRSLGRRCRRCDLTHTSRVVPLCGFISLSLPCPSLLLC